MSKRVKKIILIIIFFVIYIAAGLYVRKTKMSTYNNAITKIDIDKDYEGGIFLLNELGDYRDSQQYIEKAQKYIDYENAISLYEQGLYDRAKKEFSKLNDFEESELYVTLINKLNEEEDHNSKIYEEANSYYYTGNYDQAREMFMKLEDYKDSQQLAQKCQLILTRLMRSKVISAGIRSSGGISNGKGCFSGEDKKEKEVIESWTDIISISMYGQFPMGLRADGTVVTAHISSATYRVDTSSWTDIIEIADGQQYIVGLKADGTVVAQGHNGDGQANVDGWTDIVTIAAGWRHTVGLDSAGKVHITGHGADKLLEMIEENQNEWTDIVSISTGGGEGKAMGHIVALRKNGKVVAVGNNNSDQCNVGDWDDIIAISAGDHHTVGLKADGTVVTTLKQGDSFEEISAWTEIVAVSAGYDFTLGLKSDGTVVSAGYDKNGQRDTGEWGKIEPREEWKLLFQENNN